MLETIIALVLLGIGAFSGDGMLIMASGLYAIATNLNIIHGDLKKGKDNEI